MALLLIALAAVAACASSEQQLPALPAVLTAAVTNFNDSAFFATLFQQDAGSATLSASPNSSHLGKFVCESLSDCSSVRVRVAGLHSGLQLYSAILDYSCPMSSSVPCSDHTYLLSYRIQVGQAPSHLHMCSLPTEGPAAGIVRLTEQDTGYVALTSNYIDASISTVHLDPMTCKLGSVSAHPIDLPLMWDVDQGHATFVGFYAVDPTISTSRVYMLVQDLSSGKVLKNCSELYFQTSGLRIGFGFGLFHGSRYVNGFYGNMLSSIDWSTCRVTNFTEGRPEAADFAALVPSPAPVQDYWEYYFCTFPLNSWCIDVASNGARVQRQALASVPHYGFTWDLKRTLWF
eukprot:m.135142 g.135142  ORF g.135142 m.135142 type:complete len:346 (+) comp20152_c0_seq4:60-1097(+)